MTNPFCISSKQTKVNSQEGFTLVELIVGVAIGLIITLVVITTVITIGAQRKITTSGNNAKESAQTALSTIEHSARLAGAGLFYNGQLICPTLNMFSNPDVLYNAASILPVRIIDGGANTASDRVEFSYTLSSGGNSVVNLVDSMGDTSAPFTVANPGSFEVGNLGIIGAPGKGRACTVFQVTQIDDTGGNCNDLVASCGFLHHAFHAENGRFNPSNPATSFTVDLPRYGHGNSDTNPIGPAVIMRIGGIVKDIYEVLPGCSSLVSRTLPATAPTCTASPLAFENATPLVSNIVMLQAQYGITDNALGTDDEVDSWVDADPTQTDGGWVGTPLTQDALRQIKAIRIVVVSRSQEVSPTNVSQPCKNEAEIENTGPCAFEDAESPVINLSNVPVEAGKTWQNYRYSVYKTVIPLRNLAWNY